MRKSKSMRKIMVILQSFIENGRNGDAYRCQRRFFLFKNCEKVPIYWTYQNVRFPPARSTGIPHRQIAKEATSPDRKRGQMARSQKRPDRPHTCTCTQLRKSGTEVGICIRACFSAEVPSVNLAEFI